MGKTGRGRKGDRSDASDVSDQKLYLQPPLLELRVPETEIVFLTDLPEGLDNKEWIASHTIGFFEHINLLYGTISEFCTASSCPEMNGPGPRQYVWVDDKGKKSRLSAPQYIDYIMTYTQKTINDETIFPTKHGSEFPSTFDTHIKKLHRLLFHVLAHIYHGHFREIVLLQLHAHLNALFAHFIEFNLRFRTVEDKELEVLNDLIVALRLVPPQENSSPTSSGDNHSNMEGVSVSTATSATNGEYNDENKENISSAEVICQQPTSHPAEMLPDVQADSEPQPESTEPDENCVEMT